MKKMKKLTRKGSFFDVVGVLIGAFVIIVAFIAIGIATVQTGNAIEASQTTINRSTYTNSSQLVIDNAEKYPSFWDFLIMFVVFGLWLVAFISAIILGNNPIFLTIFIVMGLTALVVGLVFEFALSDFITNSVITPYSSSYPITLFLVDHFFLFALFFLVSVGVALYLKPGGSGQ